MKTKTKIILYSANFIILIGAIIAFVSIMKRPEPASTTIVRVVTNEIVRKPSTAKIDAYCDLVELQARMQYIVGYADSAQKQGLMYLESELEKVEELTNEMNRLSMIIWNQKHVDPDIHDSVDFLNKKLFSKKEY